MAIMRMGQCQRADLSVVGPTKVTTREMKAPKVQMPRCSSMYASMQLADAYDSTYACSRSMEASKQYHGSMQ